MSGEVIKSFLVGLGFSVDDSSLSNFNKSLVSATVKVTALYTATNLLAAGIVKSISSISGDFEKLGYEYRLIAPSINKALILRQEMLKAYSLTGINITKAIIASVKLNLSLTKTQYALKALYQSVGAKFFPLLQKQSDTFRNTLYKNMPKIQHALESFVNFILKTVQSLTELGLRLWSILSRVFDFFVMLDHATDGWSTKIIAAIAAWKLLNLTFLASPLGMILALAAAILVLWDDFKTFQEGGKSLINWGSDFTKTLVGLVAVMGSVALAIKSWFLITELTEAIKKFSEALKVMELISLAIEAPFAAIAIAIGAIITALTLADAKWNIFGGHLSGFFGGIGGKIMGLFGGTGAANLANNPTTSPMVNPVGSNSQTNIHAHSQTNINVIGSADANKTGAAVAGQQGRVHRDLVDNLGGRAF